jgi:inorganic pyrophosphatase
VSDDFWAFLDRLVSESRIVVDRPKGSQHPRYADLVYPLDYGYLKGTASGDSGGVDVWVGASGTRDLSAVLLTIDLSKRDAEIKLMLGCTEAEIQTTLNFLDCGKMRAMLVRRPKES